MLQDFPETSGRITNQNIPKHCEIWCHHPGARGQKRGNEPCELRSCAPQHIVVKGQPPAHLFGCSFQQRQGGGKVSGGSSWRGSQWHPGRTCVELCGPSRWECWRGILPEALPSEWGTHFTWHLPSSMEAKWLDGFFNRLFTIQIGPMYEINPDLISVFCCVKCIDAWIRLQPNYQSISRTVTTPFTDLELQTAYPKTPQNSQGYHQILMACDEACPLKQIKKTF